MLTSHLAAIVIAYLLGSIPFGLVLALVFCGVDVRKTGSGNIGATNVARVAPKLGAVTLLLDIAKGFAAVMIAKVIAGTAFPLPSDAAKAHLLIGLSAVFVIIGHMFPVWLKLKGGKGVATSMGVFLALMPKVTLLAIGVFALVFGLSRIVSLSSILAAAAFPLLALLVSKRQAMIYLPYVCFVCLLVIGKHYQNIGRLLSRTEPRLSFKEGKSRPSVA